MYSKEETQNMRHEFWHKLESKTRRLPGQNGKPKKWIGDRTGIRGLDLRFDVNREFAMVAMEINPTGNEKRAELWQKMLNCKTLFEAKFGGELTWDDNYIKEAGDSVIRIYVKTEGDMYNREKWPNMIYFMIDNMMRLETAFLEVQDYLIHF
ncbi:MAG: DUF4268 domain-containing protein [Bacteroidia bacterium]|nr:DUF4268 domain-containing protein [Bacteroidia bacterium]